MAISNDSDDDIYGSPSDLRKSAPSPVPPAAPNEDIYGSPSDLKTKQPEVQDLSLYGSPSDKGQAVSLPQSKPLISGGEISTEEINDIARRHDRSPEAVRWYVSAFNNAGTEFENMGDAAKGVIGMVGNYFGMGLVPMVMKGVAQRLDPGYDPEKTPKMIDEIEALSQQRESQFSRASRVVAGFATPGKALIGETLLGKGVGAVGEAVKGLGGGAVGHTANLFPKITALIGAEAIGTTVGGAYGFASSLLGSKEGQTVKSTLEGMAFGAVMPIAFLGGSAAAKPVAKLLTLPPKVIDWVFSRFFDAKPMEAIASLWRSKPSEFASASASIRQTLEDNKGYEQGVLTTLQDLGKIGLKSASVLKENVGDKGYDLFKAEHGITDELVDRTTSRFEKQLTADEEEGVSDRFASFAKMMEAEGKTLPAQGTEGFKEELQGHVEDLLVSDALFRTRQAFVNKQLGVSREIKETIPYVELRQQASQTGSAEVDATAFVDLIRNNKEASKLIPSFLKEKVETLFEKREYPSIWKEVDDWASDQIQKIHSQVDKREKEAQLAVQGFGSLLNKGENIEAAWTAFRSHTKLLDWVKKEGGIGAPIQQPVLSIFISKAFPFQKRMAMIDDIHNTGLLRLQELENVGENKVNLAIDKGTESQKELYQKDTQLKKDLEVKGIDPQDAYLRYSIYYENPAKGQKLIKPEDTPFLSRFRSLVSDLDNGRNSLYGETGVEIARRESTMFGPSGYIRHVPMQPAMVQARIRRAGEVQAKEEILNVLRDKLGAGAVSGLEDQDLSAAIRAMKGDENLFRYVKARSPMLGEVANVLSYLKDGGEIRTGAEFLKEYNGLWGRGIGDIEGKLTTEASAAYSRTARREMPLLVRELDPTRLDQGHMYNTFRASYIAPYQQQKAQIAKDLRLAGYEEEAKVIEQGIRQANGGGVPEIWQRLQKDTPQVALKLLQKNDGNIDKTLNELHTSSNLIQGIHNVMYSVALTGPHTLMQHITQPGQTLFPLISRHSSAFASDVMMETYTNLATGERLLKNNPSAIETATYRQTQLRLRSEGKMPEGGKGVRENFAYGSPGQDKGLAATFKDKTEWASNKLLSVFEQGVQFGRIVASEAARTIVRRAEQGNQQALNLLRDTGATAIDHELKPLIESGDWKKVADVWERHCVQESGLVYNRNNMSAAVRALGPFLSPFTKWPAERLGEIGYSMTKGEEGQALYKLLQPFMGFGAVNALMDVMGRKDPKFKDNLSKITGRRGFMSFDPNDSLYKLIASVVDRGGITQDKLGTSTIVNTIRDTAELGFKGLTGTVDKEAFTRLMGEDLYDLFMPMALMDRGKDYLNIFRFNVPGNDPTSFRNQWHGFFRTEADKYLSGAKEAKGNVYDKMVNDISKGIYGR